MVHGSAKPRSARSTLVAAGLKACVERSLGASLGACLALGPQAPPAAAASAMVFTRTTVDGAVSYSAVGRITEATPEAFRRSVMSPAPGTVILIDSPGGSVAGAMRLGELFRRSGVTAVVADAGGTGGAPTRCFSACVYALMGASRRIVPARSAVGIHEMAAGGQRVETRGVAADHALMRAALVRYATRMGVDPAVVEAAERTPPGALRILSESEIVEWRLAVTR